MKSYETLTVGQIVTDKYGAANVFEKYGIDYCCHGSTPLLEACKNANVYRRINKPSIKSRNLTYDNIEIGFNNEIPLGLFLGVSKLFSLGKCFCCT